jgi:hypothetical protein
MLADIVFYGGLVVLFALFVLLNDPSVARIIIGNQIDKSYADRTDRDDRDRN